MDIILIYVFYVFFHITRYNMICFFITVVKAIEILHINILVHQYGLWRVRKMTSSRGRQRSVKNWCRYNLTDAYLLDRLLISVVRLLYIYTSSMSMMRKRILLIELFLGDYRHYNIHWHSLWKLHRQHCIMLPLFLLNLLRMYLLQGT